MKGFGINQEADANLFNPFNPPTEKTEKEIEQGIVVECLSPFLGVIGQKSLKNL